MAVLNYDNVSNQRVQGTAADDTITLNGSGSAVFVDGLAGNDSISGTTLSTSGYTRSTVVGGDGNDTISGFSSDSLILGGIGADNILLNAAGTRITVQGGDGNDTIRGISGSAALIFGNGGDDNIRVRTGGSLFNATLYGGMGNDSLAGSEEGGDYLSGDIGNDLLNSDDDSRASTLIGGVGNDTINSDGRDDLLLGNQGADTFRLRNAGATVFGGQDNDTITASFAVTSSTNGSTTSTVIDSAATSSLILGNRGNDTITINTGGNTVFGGQGDDLITVASATLTATGASSGVSAGTAGNLVYGDLGNDVINVGSAAAVTVNGGDGDDEILASASDAVLTGGTGRDIFNLTGFSGSSTAALRITDFVSGTDTVRTGFAPGIQDANYREVQTNQSGWSNALTAAGTVAANNYVFVAAADAGYLFYQDASTVRGVQLAGATSLAAFAATDIT